eukprot:TRINITY_DN67162_c0_g1_i1.p1 TRINITY_DN67162_c0_g1~~TRINITY_DN67162_c0_g1_i1.p1  ORF type:complete len:642 (-),score=109.64 TRINITY_DN67162_c0_g1_i1:81-2006(-)
MEFAAREQPSRSKGKRCRDVTDGGVNEGPRQKLWEGRRPTRHRGASLEATSSVVVPSWAEKVREQVEFYFGDANLRTDKFMRRKIAEDDGGFVDLSVLLKFNRLKALKCKCIPQLAQALQTSTFLELNKEETRVRRDLHRCPVEGADPSPRTVYVEGIPLHFGVDDLAPFFALHGHVRLVNVPRHPQTKEARGFCFVEYSTQKEARAATSQIDGSWPSKWPKRKDLKPDGLAFKKLRAMTKQRWLEYRDEHKALKRCATSRGGVAEGSRTPTFPIDGDDAAVSGEICSVGLNKFAAPVEDSTSLVASTMTTPTSSYSMCATGQKHRQCCLVRVSGFSLPQTVVSIRQWVEHAVTVEYCDFCLGDSNAVLRLKSAADGVALLEDVRATGRMLGWCHPIVDVLGDDAVDMYWQTVEEKKKVRKSASAAISTTYLTENSASCTTSSAVLSAVDLVGESVASKETRTGEPTEDVGRAEVMDESGSAIGTGRDTRVDGSSADGGGTARHTGATSSLHPRRPERLTSIGRMFEGPLLGPPPSPLNIPGFDFEKFASRRSSTVCQSISRQPGKQHFVLPPPSPVPVQQAFVPTPSPLAIAIAGGDSAPPVDPVAFLSAHGVHRASGVVSDSMAELDAEGILDLMDMDL